MLRREHPSWTDDQLFAKARLINVALMAKIHTVEWTPAIIAHPTSQLAMRADWWGLVGERVDPPVRPVQRWDVLTGVPGSKKNHHHVPYSLTEEFTAVYRLHPLIPDEYTFRDPAGGGIVAELEFPDLGVLHVRERMEQLTLAGGLYSFGLANPGAIQLHNFPRFLRSSIAPTAPRSTSGRSTSCGSGSAGFPGTTASASCSTSHASHPSRS